MQLLTLLTLCVYLGKSESFFTNSRYMQPRPIFVLYKIIAKKFTKIMLFHFSGRFANCLASIKLRCMHGRIQPLFLDLALRINKAVVLQRALLLLSFGACTAASNICSLILLCERYPSGRCRSQCCN